MTAATHNDAPAVVASFVQDLAVLDKERLESEVHDFVKHHYQQGQRRPIALVTSGGTVANLEVNAVRCLDNFSTGLRGAISVEEFLRHGYAVIHVWRKGSASPYARVLNQLLELEQANFALNNQSLDKLLTTTTTNVFQWSDIDTPTLHEDLATSSKLQSKLQERSQVISKGRLLTVPFWSVEEYLAKLQICAKALQPCGSSAVLYLAAAVSDFYVPKSERSEHKISSNTTTSTNGEDNEDNHEDHDGGLVLHLRPVPKVLGLLRTTWAPQAYVISFKLETDHTILRQKAERAVNQYGCHMVIGNLLATRHTQVWVLAPPAAPAFKQPSTTETAAIATTTTTPTTTPLASTTKTTTTTTATTLPVGAWPMREISKPIATMKPTKSATTVQLDDALEEALIDVVVESHLQFLSLESPEREQAIRELFRSEHSSFRQPARYWKWGRRIVLGSVIGYGIATLVRVYFLSGATSTKAQTCRT